MSRRISDKNLYKYALALNAIIKLEVGVIDKWSSVSELHQHIIHRKELGDTDFRSIPIDFCIKFTAPTKAQEKKVKQEQFPNLNL